MNKPRFTMQLGSSMRRRRQGDGTSERHPLQSAHQWIARRKKEKRTRLALIAIGMAGLGWLTGWLVATQALFPSAPAVGDMYEVPDLYGVAVPEARKRVEDAGLTLGLVDAFRHPADSGLVVGQDPLPGQLARPGDSVRVSISLGVERREVPDVSYLRGDRARVTLELAGFSVTFDSAEADLPRGSVLQIQPAAGTQAPVPSDVRLTVSTGPAQVVMPNVVGLEEAAARDTLGMLGLTVTLLDEISPEAPSTPQVIGQDPVAETVLLRGTEVRININRRTPRADTIPPQDPRR